MPRPYRLQAEGCLYHITSRGNERKAIFSDKKDYEKFLHYVVEARDKFQFYLYAYVLMTNHYHLLIETAHPNLSRVMQYLNTAYTVFYNHRHKRSGHLFQGRYKSIVVEKDSYLLELTRYIHLNPVKAKMVKTPEKYLWSSFGEYTQNKKEKFIDKEQVEKYFKMSPKEYQSFVLDGANEKKNIFKNTRAGFLLGSDEFVEEKLRGLKGAVEGEYSYKVKILKRVEAHEIIKTVARYYGVEVDEVCKSKNKPLLAKRISVYLCKRLSFLTNGQIGDIFGLSYSAVSKVAKGVERLIEEKNDIKKDIDILNSRFKG